MIKDTIVKDCSDLIGGVIGESNGGGNRNE